MCSLNCGSLNPLRWDSVASISKWGNRMLRKHWGEAQLGLRPRQLGSQVSAPSSQLPAPSSWAVLLCFLPFPYSQGPYALPGRAWTGNVVKIKGAAWELKPSPCWTKESPASGPTRQELPAYHVSCSALLTWGSERPTLMPQGLL